MVDEIDLLLVKAACHTSQQRRLKERCQVGHVRLEEGDRAKAYNLRAGNGTETKGQDRAGNSCQRISQTAKNEVGDDAGGDRLRGRQKMAQESTTAGSKIRDIASS